MRHLLTSQYGIKRDVHCSHPVQQLELRTDTELQKGKGAFMYDKKVKRVNFVICVM
jgi:hypothetical protein